MSKASRELTHFHTHWVEALARKGQDEMYSYMIAMPFESCKHAFRSFWIACKISLLPIPYNSSLAASLVPKNFWSTLDRAVRSSTFSGASPPFFMIPCSRVSSF